MDKVIESTIRFSRTVCGDGAAGLNAETVLGLPRFTLGAEATIEESQLVETNRS